MSKIPAVPSCIPIMAAEIFSRAAVSLCEEQGFEFFELADRSRIRLQELAAKQAVDIYMLCQGEWNKNFSTAESLWSVEK